MNTFFVSIFFPQTKPPCNKIGPLFYQPGKEPEQSGVFAPRPFVPLSTNSAAKNSSICSQRRLVFRAIGRFLGLCFWFKHTIPFMVCRHVAKYLLDRLVVVECINLHSYIVKDAYNATHQCPSLFKKYKTLIIMGEKNQIY